MQRDVPVATVYKTYNYDQFKFLSENRVPDHIKALVLSFKNRMVPNAILCNEKAVLEERAQALSVKKSIRANSDGRYQQ